MAKHIYCQNKMATLCFIPQFYFCSILNLYHARVLIESVALEERKSQRVISQCQNSKGIQKICPLTASLLNNSHHEPRANFGACS